jgi:hypothetical protein
MITLPADLLSALPDGSEPVATAWWATLRDEDRNRIAELWDERVEVRFFTPQEDEQGCQDHWDAVPTVKGGRFMPSDDDGRGEWQPGYFEHLLQHPELVLAYEPEHRVFHIGCTQHEAARRCLREGQVPREFECPFKREDCYLHSLRGVQLSRRAIS